MDRNTSPILPLTDGQIERAVKATSFNLYPEEEIKTFKRLYAKRNQFSPDYIELANGSDEWLQKFILTFGQNGVMTLNPDFVMYQVYSQQVAVPFHQIACRADFQFDFDDIERDIQAYRPSLFLISNPHNPTGRLFTESELERLADAMAAVDGYLVIDEAYGEFAPDYQRPTGAHVIIVRTLSKIYGLAGLRIGIAIAEEATFDQLTRFNHPYPVNSVSLNLANELFSDEDHLNDFIAYQQQSKQRLEAALKTVDKWLTIVPSKSNFIFTYGERAPELAAFLLERGYQARQYDEPLLKQAVRYSIIALEDYDGFEQALREWSEQIDS